MLEVGFGVLKWRLSWVRAVEVQSVLEVGGEGSDGAGVGRDYPHCSNNNSVKKHQFWCLLLRHSG